MLEKAKEIDFLYIYQLYMDPQINPFLLYEVMNEEAFKPIYNNLLAEGILYLFKEDNKTLGMCKLIQQRFRNEHVLYVGGLAIHPKFFRNGFGKKLMLDIIVFAKTQNLLRIELTVATENRNAIQLYESVGFTKEGILRNYTFLKSQNKLIDEVMMSYLL